jgi:hypothetical protein
VDKRRAAGGWAFAVDRRHQRTEMVRAVKRTATRATTKARGLRATRVRAKRVMTETSPREEGDNGHNNQLGTKAATMVQTVVAKTARAITTAAKATATGAKRVMAMTRTMATTATMMPNGNNNNKNQTATTARMTATVARARVMGKKG